MRGIKKTIEEIREFAKEQGYFLLSNHYKNAHSKLKFRCPSGHDFLTSWGNFQQGGRCPFHSKYRKKTNEYFRNYIREKGYKLLTKNSISSSSNIEILCPSGHVTKMRWTDFQQGHRCSVCAGNNRRTIEEIKTYVAECGYKLLSKRYTNGSKKLKYICKENHIFTRRWSDFQQNSECPICSYIKRLGCGSINWRGGISNDPYCDLWKSNELKEMIKVRDGYQCLNPCCLNRSSRLVIHHINYNKLDCNENNLITVCNSCNSIANYDRHWYTSWYQAIMYVRYNFIY